MHLVKPIMAVFLSEYVKLWQRAAVFEVVFLQPVTDCSAAGFFQPSRQASIVTQNHLLSMKQRLVLVNYLVIL